jgi:hypothetical protein
MALATREYPCPVCGIALVESDLDLPAGQYFCPYCCTELRPSMNSSARGLQIGWAARGPRGGAHRAAVSSRWQKGGNRS